MNRDEDRRPDPDALLRRIQEAGDRSKRGKLKIYFGASPGVGKTFAMLTAARRLRDARLDVAIGVAETHGRPETEALLAGLEQLPLRTVEHRGSTLREFDLDAALRRRPAVIIVDELAHTNAPGSRHPKRWQDVEELLAAGIDVYTTVNVQHLESLNDIVGGITGIRVWETLPDRVFENAEEVVLVDLPPDELLQRLREGKVYVPEQAERAVENFFRKGNLLALRELALRRTADRVDDEVRSYRREYVGGQVWQTQDAVLVCVGPAEGSEKVVRTAARLAGGLNARWHAIYVETPQLQRLPEGRRRAILRTLKLAQDLGAETATLAAQDAVVTTIEYARKHNLNKIVVGRPARRPPWPIFGGTFGFKVGRAAPDLDVIVVSGEPLRAAAIRASEDEVEKPVRWMRYLAAAGISLAVVPLAMPLYPLFGETNIAMLFLLAVVITAVRLGRGPATLGAFVGVLAFDFCFVPPRFTFAVSDVQYVVTFAVMLAVGLVVAQLTARLRYQARVANYREERARNLFELSRELSGALTEDQVAEIADRYVEMSFRAKAAVVLRDAKQELRVAAESAGSRPQIDLAVARWCLDHNEPAGLGTDTLPATRQLYLPLKTQIATRGVLVVEPNSERLLMIPEQRRLLDTYAALIAIAAERVHYVTVAQGTLVSIESERLRNSLLEALSHDLRTPLTALAGGAEALALELARERSPYEARVVALRDASRRMAHLVDNLLEMARLQSGGLTLRKDWHSLEELAGSALRALAPVLQRHEVVVELPRELPLVQCDGVLIERVLTNLLENASKYTPAGTRIGITATAAEREMEIVVWDDGPGLPPGRENEIFEKFTRGTKESTTPGVGLGLSICRAIVEAHGGRIRAENRQPHGARFTLTLPQVPAPAIAEEAPAAVDA